MKTLGIPCSPFTGAHKKPLVAQIANEPIEIRKKVLMPESIRAQILEGMECSLWSDQGGARASIIQLLRSHPSIAIEHKSLAHQMVGKTSTAEILHNPNISPSNQAQMVKHIWFAGLSFMPDGYGKIQFEDPELVVVVFFRFAIAGKEAAPITSQMIKKWREIKKKCEPQ